MKKIIALSAAVLIANVSMHAATLGERTFGIAGGYVDMDGLDGWMIGAELNIPVMDQIDLKLSFSHNDMDWDIEERQLALEGIYFFGNDASAIRPYVGALIGFGWWDTGWADGDTLIFGGSAGVEIPVSDELSVRLGGRIVKAEEADDPTFQGVIEGNYWLNSEWAVLAGYTYSNNDGTSANQVMAGVRMRF